MTTTTKTRTKAGRKAGHATAAVAERHRYLHEAIGRAHRALPKYGFCDESNELYCDLSEAIDEAIDRVVEERGRCTALALAAALSTAALHVTDAMAAADLAHAAGREVVGVDDLAKRGGGMWLSEVQ